jgi:hypothetical protein
MTTPIKRASYLAITSILSLAVVGCPMQPAEAPDKPIPVEEPSDCEAGCARAQELECSDFLDELKGAAEELDTCPEACEHLVNTGIVVGVACWKTTQTCEEFDTKCS